MGGDLGASDLAAADLNMADLAYVPECGNGVRDPMEGCDDNNKLSSDGCSSTCVLEPSFVTPFVDSAALGPLNGPGYLAAAQDGTIYVKVHSGGGGASSIYKIDANTGAVDKTGITGEIDFYAGDQRTIGNDLYSCGTYIMGSTHAVCQKWTNGAGSPMTVLDQTGLTLDAKAYATSDGATWWFNTQATGPSYFWKATGTQMPMQIDMSADGSGLQGQELYHPTLGILLARNGTGSILKDSGGSGTGPFVSAYTLPAGNVGVMALDHNGMLWVSCWQSGTFAPCTAGSVWIVDLGTMTAKPALDNWASVDGLAFAADAKRMVVIAQGKIWRYSL
jgi:cysteine-rich repeat protein